MPAVFFWALPSVFALGCIDEVRTRVEVKEKNLSRPQSGRGRITFEARLSNKKGELLLSMHPTVLFACRTALKQTA